MEIFLKRSGAYRREYGILICVKKSYVFQTRLPFWIILYWTLSNFIRLLKFFASNQVFYHAQLLKQQTSYQAQFDVVNINNRNQI